MIETVKEKRKVTHKGLQVQDKREAEKMEENEGVATRSAQKEEE